MQLRDRALSVVLAYLATACSDQAPGAGARDARRESSPSAEHAPRGTEGRGVDGPVILVTIDGVRWQEIFEGSDPRLSQSPAMPTRVFAPNLVRLGTERGALIGAPDHGTIAASGPNFVSLPGYTEILGGRKVLDCTSNDCDRIALPSILDEARATGASVAGFASWEKLSLAATASPGGFHLSCGREGQSAIDPWPGYGDYRPDRITGEAALAYYARERPDVFYLGLGDPDELAHRGDYPRYLQSIRQADDIIGRLLALADQGSERGRNTHVIVTADHGRAHDFASHGAMPEAARVWMIAAGPRFGARGKVRSTELRHLADIAPTLRVLLGLPPDAAASAGSPLDELFAAPVTPTSPTLGALL